MAFFETRNLAVGYNGRAIIHGIDLSLNRGKILTLIGPNGAGKSTILKSITRQLTPVGGGAFLEGTDVAAWKSQDFARKTAVVLTERVRPELMTCADVVGMGRYPYTGLFGRLTEEDRQIVHNALARVHALEIADRDFSTLSDGQCQRIMLARAICQSPELIVLDEPTAYLDIRHKIELLSILRDMAREENITVIMSLHEIDLAMKASDWILCVKGETIAAFGTPEEIMASTSIEELYDMEKGSFNLTFGSVELEKPKGAPQVFVIGGGGCGIGVYRALQKQNIPFAAGILYENDLDYPVARALSDHVVSVPAFSTMDQADLEQAMTLMNRCGSVLYAGTPFGEHNALCKALLDCARESGMLRDTIPSML